MLKANKEEKLMKAIDAKLEPQTPQGSSIQQVNVHINFSHELKISLVGKSFPRWTNRFP